MKRLKLNTVESTPFVSFEVKATKTNKGGWFKMYRSKNRGTYGYQVHYEGEDYNDENGYFCGKTGGCGYNKEADALNSCLVYTLGQSPSCHYECKQLFKELHKGGNYYESTASKMLKIIKNVR